VEDLGRDGRIILHWTFKKYDRWKGLNWTDLAQNRDRWQVLLNVGMKLCIP
jgi:hypothetical protein